MAGSGFVAVLVIDLHFPDAGSLKGKRKDLSSVKAQLHGRLGAAVSEIGGQDTWQRSTLAVTASLTGGTLGDGPVARRSSIGVERWLVIGTLSRRRRACERLIVSSGGSAR